MVGSFQAKFYGQFNLSWLIVCLSFEFFTLMCVNMIFLCLVVGSPGDFGSFCQPNSTESENLLYVIRVRKSVCEVCRNIGESESEWIRESTQKCGGQEKAGLPEDRKRKWCEVAKWKRKPSADVGVQWAGVCVLATLPCVVSGRGTVFFLL